MTVQQMTEMLRQNGIRPTQQRLAIYRYLYEHRTHPSADEVFGALREQYPTLSLMTVYNTLHSFEQAGLIRSLTIRAGEQRFDAGMHSHGHFLCKDCDTILDFDLPEPDLHRFCPEGCTAEHCEIYSVGRCAACTE